MGDGQNMEKSADDDDMTKSHQQSSQLLNWTFDRRCLYLF